MPDTTTQAAKSTLSGLKYYGGGRYPPPYYLDSDFLKRINHVFYDAVFIFYKFTSIS